MLTLPFIDLFQKNYLLSFIARHLTNKNIAAEIKTIINNDNES